MMKVTSQRAERRCGRAAAMVCLLAALSAGEAAHASPFEVYGASARGIALGNAMTAEAAAADAVFYNVATLTRAVPGVSVAFMVGTDGARVALAPRPAGYDIDDYGSATPTVPSAGTQNLRSDTGSLGTFGTVTLGAVTALGSPRFRLGFLATFPTFGVDGASTRFSDERERLFSNQLSYELVGDRARRFDIEGGLAYRVFDQLSIGLGFTLLPTATIVNGVYLQNATDQSEVDIALSQRQGFNAGFTAGLLGELSDWMRLGVSFRQGVGFPIDGSNQIQIRGLSEGDVDEYPINQQLSWLPQSSPTTVSVGGAADLERTTILLDVKWAQWANYRDTQGEEAGFENTLSPRAGLEYRYSGNTTARIGLSWDPSPVPDQVGRTNYVDNDRAGASLGASHRFELMGRDLQISWYLQGQALVTRDTAKASAVAYPQCADGVTVLCDEVPDDLSDPRTGAPLPATAGLQTGNPGFPGFSSGGWLGAMGIEFQWFL